MNTRRGFLKGLAAVVMGVAISLPALKKDPELPPIPVTRWNGQIIWRGNLSIQRPNQIRGIIGHLDSFEALS